MSVNGTAVETTTSFDLTVNKETGKITYTPRYDESQNLEGIFTHNEIVFKELTAPIAGFRLEFRYSIDRTNLKIIKLRALYPRSDYKYMGSGQCSIVHTNDRKI